ncbi:hypothetical protein B7494_g734 [Chlorociboria aeruginascens]|nr:hypothetical protein B7494_g734 [Chlorociboria aeruginascens]
MQKVEVEIKKGEGSQSIEREPAANNTDLEKGAEDHPIAEEYSSTSNTIQGDIATTDPNLVGWDGDNDPANPMNWSEFKKYSNVLMVSLITLTVNLAASMFAPGVNAVLSDFHSSSGQLGAFTVSVYVLGFALAPLVIAPLSELYGRLPLYHVSSFFFLIFTVACALSTNMAMFIVFRLLAGCAGSAPLAIGGGSIADMIPQEKRGGAMAIFVIGPLLGPVIGPIVGAFISAALGWRWIFWILSIMVGVVWILSIVLMRETYAIVLLDRKAKRLQKQGNPGAVSILQDNRKPGVLFKVAIVRPLKILLLSPIVFMLCLYIAIVFGYLYLLFTTFPLVFEEQYNFASNIVGLSYLGLGMGMALGLVGFSLMSDRLLKSKTKAGGGEMKPEYRLPLMLYCSPILPIGFFWYGWSAQAEVHWIVPILGTTVIGFGVLNTFVYLVDAFPQYAASALAANTVFRSILGTVLPLAGSSLYAKLGLGWGNSLLGFIAAAFCPVTFVFYRYGEQIRKRYPLKL